MGSRIRLSPGCAPKMSCAIGTPEARVFLEPQKTAAARSAGEKPRALLAQVVAPSTTWNSASAPANVAATVVQPWPDHTPHFIESQKEV